jgi:hypothetical protein
MRKSSSTLGKVKEIFFPLQSAVSLSRESYSPCTFFLTRTWLFPLYIFMHVPEFFSISAAPFSFFAPIVEGQVIVPKHHVWHMVVSAKRNRMNISLALR